MSKLTTPPANTTRAAVAKPPCTAVCDDSGPNIKLINRPPTVKLGEPRGALRTTGSAAVFLGSREQHVLAVGRHRKGRGVVIRPVVTAL